MCDLRARAQHVPDIMHPLAVTVVVQQSQYKNYIFVAYRDSSVNTGSPRDGVLPPTRAAGGLLCPG